MQLVFIHFCSLEPRKSYFKFVTNIKVSLNLKRLIENMPDFSGFTAVGFTLALVLLSTKCMINLDCV